MIPQSFEYVRPLTLTDALNALASGAGKALAGGMSLVPMMKLRLATPEKLVDLGRIADLAYIREDGPLLRIGAMTTHYQIESSALLAAKCPLMTRTVLHIGDVQVRNLGSLGGSIAHADPAADWPAALLALDAVVKLQSMSGSREMPIDEFLVDTFTTALEPGELVTEISIPVDPAGASSAYVKMVQPASGFAIIGVAVHLVREGGRVARCRVGVTGFGAKAFRALGVEASLVAGKTPAEAVAGMAEGVEANSDIHASGEYRRQMCAVYARRALESALA